MKRRSGRTAHPKSTAVASIFSCLILVATSVSSAELKEAHVTQVIKDVKLLPQQAAPRPAAVNDPVRDGTAVRTGTQSRSELTFTDLTITRLGANTIFSFNEGTRTMNLGSGAILFQVPKGSGGATIKTAAVTAAITGTTGIGEFHPATATTPLLSKWLCLEGTFHVYLPDGQSVEIGAGKMVSTDGKTFSKVLTFDIGQLMKSSLLVNGFDTALASLDLIRVEEQRQLVDVVTVANLNDPTRILNVIDQGTDAEATATPTTPTPTPITPTPTPVTPTPTPSKTGTPPVIAADPYIIDQNTTIQTDPAITRNGVTDFGKIYRGQAIDGLASAYLFGSTSAFDTASGFDDQIGTGNGMGGGTDSGAVFKFTSLQLIGDPTVSTIGGEINLALIGVNGITSGGPGATLTFAGIRGLLLATQNGSINIGSEISFSGLHDITFYARGEDSDLTLGCSISTLSQLHLYAENAVNLSGNLSTMEFTSFSGGDFNMTGGSIVADTISIISNANVSFSLGTPLTFNTTDFFLQADGNIQVNDSLEVNQANNGQSDGLNILLRAGGAINIGGDLYLTTDARGVDIGGNILVTSEGATTIGGALTLVIGNGNGGQIGTGGNISFLVTGEGATTIGGALTLIIGNANDGQIGTGGNISFTTGGDVTANSIGASIIDRDGGSILSGGNLTFNVGGVLTTASDANFVTSSRNGGAIGSNVILSLHAASASFGGSLAVAISANAGGHIAGALVNISFTGDLTIQGDAQMDIENSGLFVSPGNFVGGGIIDSDAVFNFTAGNVFVGGSFLDVGISYDSGALIGGDALVTFNANNVTAVGDAIFEITKSGNDGVTSAGTIGGDAILTLNVASISSATLDVRIDNSGGGSIGGDARVNIGATSLSSGSSGDLFTRILNNGGSSVGGDATVNVAANAISAGGNLDALIDNTGGSIGGDAIIGFTGSGNINVANAALFHIFNGDADDEFGGGTIGGDATITVTAGSLSAGSLLAEIDSDGGTIGGSATINFHLGGALTTTTGDATFRIFSGLGIATPSGSPLLIDVFANSMNIGGSLVAGVFLGGTPTNRDGVLVHATNDIIVGNQINVQGSVTAGGDISAVNGITFGGSQLSAGGDITSSAGSIGQDFGNQLQSGTITAGGNISAAGYVASFPGITAGGSITASSLFANTVSAGTDITIRALGGGITGGIFVNSISAGGALILMNTPQVRANGASSDGSIGFTPNDFFLSVDSIMSTGPTFPILTSDGENADPNIGNDNPGNGGNIAVTLNAGGLTVGAGGDLDHIEANGGDYHVPSIAGGNAGTVSIIATGDVTLNDGANGAPAITTYTGFIPAGGIFTLGNGGTVSIETPGTVTVNSTIEVSSNDTPGFRPSPNGITPPGRRSARGGNINLTSHKSSQAGRAVAINVTSSSQLLSLLNAAAPGPGGKITILATGANSDVNVKGRVQADRGTIDIQHSASGGHVALGDATANSIDMRADVIKVGAFGANGQLIVGGGTLSADSILKLYAPGSNGEINFIANVTLSSGSATILAGDTITIQPTRVVTIAGNGGPAQVYTNNANYSGFGGSNPNNGTFGGNGANNPLPLGSRPPFNPTPGGH